MTAVGFDHGHLSPPRTPLLKGEGGVNVAHFPSPLRERVRGGGYLTT